jgi:hypothetical protein
MATFSTTDVGRALPPSLVGADMFYYLSIIYFVGTPDKAGSIFFKCYRKIEREGGPDNSELKNMFQRLVENVPALHAEAVRRDLVRQVDV